MLVQSRKNRGLIVKIAAWTVASLLTLALMLVVSVAAVLQTPVPNHSGEFKLQGLSSEVTVKRDSHGIPHIYAKTDHDLFMAQGFLHAQDRFFEMDYRRHVTGGRLGELLGGVEKVKQADVVIRTMGWRAIAATEWNLISQQTRDYYTAYARGVNEYLRGKKPWQVANEYAVLGLNLPVKDIEPWTGIDSLAWLKAMAWDLKANIEDENERLAAYQKLGSVEAVHELFPSYEGAGNEPVIAETKQSNLAERVTYPRHTSVKNPSLLKPEEVARVEKEVLDKTVAQAVQNSAAALAEIPELLGRGQGVGSNSFVVAGKYTASGKPVLANDPHLTVSYPSVWYQIGLHCIEKTPECTFNVSGFSFSGMPGVVIGRNDKLAWGLTNLGGDVTDYVVEKNLSDTTYERDGKAVPYEIWREKFEVAGGEPYEAEVRRSVHGPIVSGTLINNDKIDGYAGEAKSYSVALEWTALQPGTTGESIFAINRAQNPKDIAAAAALFSVPAQNILFATADGDIGYQAPGRFPIRPKISAADGQLDKAQTSPFAGADGRWPRPGWLSSYDWQGFYAPEDMPALLNPESGIIVPANQQITPREMGPYLGSYADPGYRSQQMLDYLRKEVKNGGFNADRANQTMLLDRSPYGFVLGEKMAEIDLGSTENGIKTAQQIFRDWLKAGAHAGTEEAGMAIAASLYAHLLHNTLHDNIAWFSPNSGARYVQVLQNLLSQPDHNLWDNAGTPEVEKRDDILRRSWADMYKELSGRLGTDPQKWRWGALHVETPTHSVLGGPTVPDFIRNHFNNPSRQVPGGPGIPNAMNFEPPVKEGGAVDYELTGGPSMRMAVDLGEPDSAQWVISSGLSGHPLSSHVIDQFEKWSTGQMIRWTFNSGAVDSETKKVSYLRPKR
ncbi:MAG: penicillin acylase family protein [Microbacteriaceae bacterium]|nr:penicillin acylase family protein [Microbacteriaceae bacterium]